MSFLKAYNSYLQHTPVCAHQPSAGEATMTTIYVIAAIVVVLIALGHIQFRA